MEQPSHKLYLIPSLLAEHTHEFVLPPGLKEIIQVTKIYFVEEVKTARRFISSLKLGIVIDSLTFIDLNKDTTYEQLFPHLYKLRENAGVLSEAGCPGIADPGSLAVEIAHSLGMQVVPLVGPSSILLALMASGFSGQSFAFHGYLPIDKDERLKRLRILEKDVLSKKQTQLFIETPYRNNQMMESILKNLNPALKLCIACNITAPDEYIKTRSIAEWKKNPLPDLHKKPCMFLLG
jgi:16S rRNA (cytidine1402-2'-O)-methyltransferase